MEIGLILISIVFVIMCLIFKKTSSNEEYFEAQGIPHDKPYPIIGNILPLFTKKEGIVQFLQRYCNKYRNEKIIGFHGLMGESTLIIKDPTMLKQIMIRDFDYFVNRDSNHHLETDRLLSRSVLNLRDQKWKEMRTMLSPIYTSSKMKFMFGLLVECFDEFMKLYEDKARANGGKVEIDTHDVYARVTANGIATAALGFKGDCLINKDSKIFEIAFALETDFTDPIKLMLTFMFPKLFKLLKLQIFRKSIHEFFLTNVMNEIKRRKDGNIARPDVIQLLVQAKDGQLKIDDGDVEELSYNQTKAKKAFAWTDEDLAAQALVFFLGGFETTATLMQVISYELAKNPNVQQTLIEEVDEMLRELNGKTISYEQLHQMKFLEMIVNETLRKWPSFRGTIRSCTKDYTLKDDESGQSYLIKEGTFVFLPFGEIQMDPKYFPEPEKFDPYRFSDENKSKITSGSFLPFGSGPRICLGSRYALLQAKLLLFHVMTKFRIEKNAMTPEKLTHSKRNSGFSQKIYLNLEIRK